MTYSGRRRSVRSFLILTMARFTSRGETSRWVASWHSWPLSSSWISRIALCTRVTEDTAWSVWRRWECAWLSSWWSLQRSLPRLCVRQAASGQAPCPSVSEPKVSLLMAASLDKCLDYCGGLALCWEVLIVWIQPGILICNPTTVRGISVDQSEASKGCLDQSEASVSPSLSIITPWDLTKFSLQICIAAASLKKK